jgi:hypothetical protein
MLSSVKLNLIRYRSDSDPYTVTLPISVNDLFALLREKFSVGSLLIEQYFPGDNVPLSGWVLLDYPWDVEYMNETNLENITIALYEQYKGDIDALSIAFVKLFGWTPIQTMIYFDKVLTPVYPNWRVNIRHHG